MREAEQSFQGSEQLIANSQREFEKVHQLLNQKQQELNRLNAQYEDVKAKENTHKSHIAQLVSNINQTNNQINNAINEYNHTPRIRILKRRQLYNIFTQYKSRLESQLNEHRNLNSQANYYAQQVSLALSGVNSIKNEVNSLSSQQGSLQAELNRLQAGYANKIAQAQKLCTAQGLSSDVCRKVAKVADDSDLSAFEAELDANIEQVEFAQQALEHAKAFGDESAVHFAQENLDQAIRSLVNALEDTYTTLGDINHFLGVIPEDVAIPVQAQLISRYSNTALSELSASVNSVLQIGRNLDRHLLSQDRSNVWVNTEASQRTYRSDYNRPYKQNLTLTQIGVAQRLNSNMQIGAVLSHSRANNEFDENVSGTSRLMAVNGFVKGEWNNGIFASFDLGYGRIRNNIKFDEENKTFHRNILSAGGNIGASLDWGINVTPSVGMRYYRLSSTNYQLDGANINSKTLHLTTYRAGVMLDKTFDINGVKFTPSFSSNYYDATQRKLAIEGVLSVNDVALKQQFGRYFTHELGFSAQMKQWNISTNIGMLKGSDVALQKFASLKVGFTW